MGTPRLYRRDLAELSRATRLTLWSRCAARPHPFGTTPLTQFAVASRVHEDFASREVAHASIADYIESFYNTARRHSSIGYVSPIEFELRSQVAAFAA